jgi:hypothetical protein
MLTIVKRNNKRGDPINRVAFKEVIMRKLISKKGKQVIAHREVQVAKEKYISLGEGINKNIAWARYYNLKKKYEKNFK